MEVKMCYIWIISDFWSIGYQMNVTMLCAADYTVPQKRERVIFIGNRLGKRNYHSKPLLSPDEHVTTGQAIGDLIDQPEDKAFNHVPRSIRRKCRHGCLLVPRARVYTKAILMPGRNALGTKLPVPSRRTTGRERASEASPGPHCQGDGAPPIIPGRLHL